MPIVTFLVLNQNVSSKNSFLLSNAHIAMQFVAWIRRDCADLRPEIIRQRYYSKTLALWDRPINQSGVYKGRNQ